MDSTASRLALLSRTSEDGKVAAYNFITTLKLATGISLGTN